MGEFADKLAAKSPAFQRAYLGSLPQNQVKSGNLEKYYHTLTNFDFLVAKIQHPAFGVQALIADYDLVADLGGLTHPESHQEQVKALKLIQAALRLSAHVLHQDKTQLAGQLLGRLLSFEVPEIQTMLAAIKQSKMIWLRPLTPSLTPPGGGLIRTLTGHTSEVLTVAVTPDGKLAISGSDDNTLKVWDLATGEEVFTLTGHTSSVQTVAVTPDGKLAISGSDDRLKVWDLATAEVVSTLSGHTFWVQTVAVTPDSKLAISGSRDNTLKVRDWATGEVVSTLSGHTSNVLTVAVTPDGKLAISGSWDKTLKVWNLATAEVVSTLTGHTSSVETVAVTPDGKLAISGSDDETLKVWDLVTGDVIVSFTTESPLYCCAVTPDGLTIVAGEASGRVHFLRLEGMEIYRLPRNTHIKPTNHLLRH